MKFPESRLAHRLLDGLVGIEIGGSAHNPFNIPGCVNVDYTADPTTVFKQEELRLCGETLPVHIVAPAWDLPFDDASLDFVLSSHVIEHCWDVIGTIEEWFRVLKPGGLVFMVVPHKERTFDKDRERTTLEELVARHTATPPAIDLHEHYSVWVTQDWYALCRRMGWKIIYLLDVDDKVGNGFTVVLRKPAT